LSCGSREGLCSVELVLRTVSNTVDFIDGPVFADKRMSCV